ncbi:MAG: biotin-dependent carboxyltransferase family protein [Burkholderiaceae bacterium]
MGKALDKLVIKRPGLLTSIQDQGRPGLLHAALSRGGAMDPMQMALANRLVGNPMDAAGLEFTGMGPTLFFERPAAIAWTGAVMAATWTAADGTKHPVSSHRPVLLPAKSLLQFGACASGFRCWLAVAGGLEVERLLGSRSQHLAAELGLPRLTANTELSIGPGADLARSAIAAALDRDPQAIEIGGASKAARLRSTRWSLRPSIPESWPAIQLACLSGRHLHLLADADRQVLMTQAWQVSARSNRQGLGLEGQAINTAQFSNLQSEPIREGTVQLPPAGMPFVLLAEHQSTGGYPRVLEVISAMTSVLAQAGPNSRIIFKLVDDQEADGLARAQQRSFEETLAAVDLKLQQ